jgi:hypothetical protein
MHAIHIRSVHIEAFTGGVQLAEMLFKSQCVGASGDRGEFVLSRNKITIWDESKGKRIIELALRRSVLSIRLRKDMMSISALNTIYAYTLADYKLLDIINTYDNSEGVLALNCKKDYKVLVCPYTVAESVRVQLYGECWFYGREESDECGEST